MRKLQSLIAAAALLAAGSAFAQGASAKPGGPPRLGSRGEAGQQQEQLTPEKITAKLKRANEAEIRLGELAQQRAESPRVRDFAGMLVKEHQKQLEQLNQFAQQNKIELGTGLSDAQPGQALDQAADQMEVALGAMSGPEFDRMFMGQMVLDHDRNIMTVQRALEQLRGTPVEGLLTQTLPVLQKHRQQAYQILGTLETPPRQARPAPGRAR